MWGASVLLYALNRWVLKPTIASAFLRDLFNDVLLVPCALPILLAGEEQLDTRGRAGPPTALEVVTYTAGWSVTCEVLGPAMFPWSTSDPWDVVAYMGGAIVAAACWRSTARRRTAM